MSDGLAEWIASDWEISPEEASVWIDSHRQFLDDLDERRLKLSQSPGGLPPNLWLNVFLYSGRPTVIVAPNGQGKTYFASWLTRKALIYHPDWTYATNIPFYFFDPRYEDLRPKQIMQIRSLSGMFELIAANILKGQKTALILDETESFSNSHNWRDGNWIAFINISRHLMVRGPLLVYHATNLIPYEMRSGQVGNQILPVLLHDGQRLLASFSTKPHAILINSSDPILPYSHYGWGGFKIDIDVLKLEQEIVEIDIRKAANMILKNLARYKIKDEVDKGLSEKRRKAVMARWNKERGLT